MCPVKVTIEATFDGQKGTKVAIDIFGFERESSACLSFVSRNLRNRKKQNKYHIIRSSFPRTLGSGLFVRRNVLCVV